MRFTGRVSSPLPTADTAVPAARPAPGPAAYWRGWQEIRADLRSSVGLVLALALTGIPLGLLWWLLAPRADFRITADGPVVIGAPPEELLVADDSVLVLLLAAAGLLMGAAAWFLRRRRGVATIVALPLGAVLAAAVAWQVGEFLGSGPSAAELEAVGSRVTTALTLGSLPALAVAAFTATAAYLIAVLYAPGDDLGRAGTVRPVDDPDVPVDEPAPATV
ncbi:MAG: hypothetical protein JWP33_2711 [Blastococcus sp.]|nr:hypothetical protein [Blastococcus sp.]